MVTVCSFKAKVNNEAWLGLIREFMEDEDKVKVANFIPFSTEKKIRNKVRKSTDFLHVFLPFCT